MFVFCSDSLLQRAEAVREMASCTKVAQRLIAADCLSS